ncbi:hypothetical protein TNIN_259261 [Trichonephila inaurata madagascariensis]|uniref:Uncharacterized protein n=1 Tax=Trichonephila inaurata madagascariensis TaxID=2747483 RepID=A0A8X7C5Q3_9ARAC|nr:hypothetical protein TNIN_259261 [Trichonephila inaurata madagascariensis]
MTSNDSETKVSTKSNFIACKNNPGSKSDKNFFKCSGVHSSEAAYACVIYAVQRNREATKVRMLGSKSKVTPLKPLCIPRLELNGALLLAWFCNFV